MARKSAGMVGFSDRAFDQAWYRPATQWVKPGLIGRVKRLAGRSRRGRPRLETIARGVARVDHFSTASCDVSEPGRPGSRTAAPTPPAVTGSCNAKPGLLLAAVLRPSGIPLTTSRCRILLMSVFGLLLDAFCVRAAKIHDFACFENRDTILGCDLPCLGINRLVCVILRSIHRRVLRAKCPEQLIPRLTKGSCM